MSGVTQEYNFYTVIFSTTFLTPRKEDEIRSMNHYRNYSDLKEKSYDQIDIGIVISECCTQLTDDKLTIKRNRKYFYKALPDPNVLEWAQCATFFTSLFERVMRGTAREGLSLGSCSALCRALGTSLSALSRPPEEFTTLKAPGRLGLATFHRR